MVAKTTREKTREKGEKPLTCEKIMSWKLVLTTQSGRDIDITDIPNDVALVVDDFIADDIESNNDFIPNDIGEL
jgi:hypothetical protein